MAQLGPAPRVGDRQEGEVGAVAGQMDKGDGDAVGRLQRDGRAWTQVLVQEPAGERAGVAYQLGVGVAVVLVGDGQAVGRHGRGVVHGAVQRLVAPPAGGRPGVPQLRADPA